MRQSTKQQEYFDKICGHIRRIRPAEAGLNLIDFTGSGSLITATIFSNTNSEGNYFYTTSRHTQLPGAPPLSMPSQWTGFCKIIE
jgi:hypothetical protein